MSYHLALPLGNVLQIATTVAKPAATQAAQSAATVIPSCNSVAMSLASTLGVKASDAQKAADHCCGKTYSGPLADQTKQLGKCLLGEGSCIAAADVADAVAKATQFVGITSDTLESIVTDCCHAFESGSAKATEKCILDAAGQAVGEYAGVSACEAAGVALSPFTGGISAGVAIAATPLCAWLGGKVGRVIADRVAGYNKTQEIAAGVGAAVCGAVSGGSGAPLCAFVAAELVGFLENDVGPLIEGLFDPGGAARRENAKRTSDNQLYFASEQSVIDAEQQIQKTWIDSVGKLWDLYDSLFTTEAMRAQLRFGSYNDFAVALYYAGAVVDVLTGADVANAIAQTKAQGRYVGLCEAPFFSRDTSGTRSVICAPRLISRFQQAILTAHNAHEGSQIAKATAAQLLQISQAFFDMLPAAISAVASKITVTAAVIKHNEAVQTARSRSSLATRATTLASRVEAAADAAGKGLSFSERNQAAKTAQQQANTALLAYNAIRSTFGDMSTPGGAQSAAAACAQDADCKKASVAVARATAAAAAAQKNATRANVTELVVGSAVTAGVAGALYWFLRK